MRYFVLAAFLLLNSAFSQTKNYSDEQTRLNELEKFYSEVHKDSLGTGKEFAYEAFELSKSINDTISQIDAALYIGKAEATEFNFDSSLVYLNKALLFSTRIEDSSLIAESFTGLGHHYFLKPDYEIALEYLRKSEQLLEKVISNHETVVRTKFYLSLTLDKLGKRETALKYAANVIEEIKKPSTYLARIYAHISIIYRDAADMKRAISYLMKSLELSNNLGDYRRSSRNYILLAGFTRRTGNWGRALKYYKMAIEAAKKSKHPRSIGYVYMNFGSGNFTEGNLEEAMKYNKIALPYFKKINDLHYLAFTNNNIGDIFFNIGKIDSARIYTERALQYGLKSNNRISIGLSHHSLGKIAMQNNDYAKAVDHYKKSLEDDFIENVIQNYYQLSESYSKLGRPDSALHYLKLHDVVKDSMYNISSQRLVIDAETKYNVDQKVKELEAARAEKKELEEKFVTSRNLTLFFIVGGFVIVGFVIFYYRNKTIEFIQKLSPLNEDGSGDKRRLKTVIKAIDNASGGNGERNNLSDEIVNEIIIRLDKIMKEERLYLDPQITQATVAKKIKTNTAYLSRAINQKYNLNFSSYVNTFRVKEAEKIISGDESELYTFEGISRSVGFTSKSAFYNAFKKFTGKTPSKYAENMRKN